MPLACEKRGVTRVAQLLCNRSLVKFQVILIGRRQQFCIPLPIFRLVRSFTIDEIRDPRSLRILASHHAGARWAANRAGSISSRESHSLLRQTINPRRFIKSAAEATN